MDLAAGRLKMAGKALESFQTPPYPLWPLPWQSGARFPTGSDKLASWFSG